MKGIFMTGVSIVAIVFGDIDFTANDWLYPRFFSCQVEINNTIHSTMVGNGKAIHAQFLSPGNKLGNAAHTIKQAVFSVDMKMDKLLWHCLNYNMGFHHHFLAAKEKLRIKI
jgi:hypothetical protein